MQSSRQKAPCAYAKVCKTNPKNAALQAKTEVPISPRSKRCENIYEELMNQLDLDESQYIKNLCKKNQVKMKKIEEAKEKAPLNKSFKDITNFATDPSQKSIRNDMRQSSSNNLAQVRSNSSIKGSDKEIEAKSKRKYSKKMEMSEQSSFSQQEQPSNQFFLSHLDRYITTLKQNESKKSGLLSEKVQLNNYKSQGQRQFRRTVELSSSKQKRQSQDFVSRAKYSKLLDKLHEELVQKQALEYKLECKQIKMDHMKSIIQQMYEEIAILRRKLANQVEQKEKYSSIAQQFASKVHNVRKSKEKHYIPHHQKRNSHVPSSNSYSKDFGDFFNKTSWQDGKSTVQHLHDFERTRSREESSTLKKKGMHRYKISEIFMEGSESQQEKASIYHDSYL